MRFSWFVAVALILSAALSMVVAEGQAPARDSGRGFKLSRTPGQSPDLGMLYVRFVRGDFTLSHVAFRRAKDSSELEIVDVSI